MKDKAIEINNKGVAHFLKKEFDEALDCYDQALKLNPNNVSVLNNLGLFYHQQQQYPKALSFFEKAIAIESKPNFLVNAGNTLAMMGDIPKAKARYLEAIRKDPNYSNPYICIAKLCTHEGNFDDAALYWKTLIDQSSQSEFKLELAKVYILQSSYDKAANILYEIAESSDLPEIWFQIGRCEFQMRNHGLADKAFKKALSEAPDHLEYRYYLALNYLAFGNLDSAIQQLDMILKLDPENSRVLTEKGVILCSINQYGEATRLFEKVLDIDPKNEKAKKYKELISEKIDQSSHE